MHSCIHQALTICLVLFALTDARRRPFIPGKSNKVPESEPTQDTRAPDVDMADMQRRMTDVELSSSVMKREMLASKSENRVLKEEMRSMSALFQQVDEAHRRVEELQRLLTVFESFFGVLYTEVPDAFDREIKVEKRLGALNEFIGNRQAELMALRPSPPVVMASPDEHPVDQEMMGIVLQELSSENTNLKRRLDRMETRMSSPTTNRQDVVTVSEPDEATQERLDRLESIVALQLAPLLDGDVEDQATTLDSRRLAPDGATPTKPLALSDMDTEFLREELNSIRSISSTRKSIFSAAATRHMYGEPGVHKVIQFDEVFTNKGNHFHEENSTFICYITGYYYFTFTMRSYDHRYLGVNLLKNGERVTSVSGESDPVRNQMMTQSVVLHLNEGDKVWVTISPSDSFAIYSDHSKYCTFSGFLLYKGK